ncbi:hypothetical protein [Actinoplanes sp. NPDC051494]|uniref:hypothetical protein n=1 Tax=Actinoplanes sp. NPDC051494 TaxID=3363907 RepID=UPI00378AB77D
MTALEELAELRTAYRTVRAEPDGGSAIHRMRLDAQADQVARDIADLIAADTFTVPEPVHA